MTILIAVIVGIGYMMVANFFLERAVKARREETVPFPLGLSVAGAFLWPFRVFWSLFDLFDAHIEAEARVEKAVVARRGAQKMKRRCCDLCIDCIDCDKCNGLRVDAAGVAQCECRHGS